MLRTLFVLIAILCVAQANLAVADTPRDAAAKIGQLIQTGDLESAAKALTTAVAEHPEAMEVRRLHYALAQRLEIAGENLAGAEQMHSYLQYLGRQHRAGQAAAPSPLLLDRMTSLYVKAGKAEQGLERLDALLKEAQDANVDSRSLERAKVLLLADAGRAADAEAIIESVLSHANTLMVQNANSELAVLTKAHALALRRDFLERANSDQAEQAATDYRDFVAEQAKRLKNLPAVVDLYARGVVESASRMAASDPKQAQQQLAELKEYLTSIDATDQAVQEMVTRLQRTVTSLEARVATALRHEGLVGTDAPAIQPTAWVNGSLDNDALKGKVVLVDFWAVWCGPCIATFPHLREWREKYHDQGFEIVGVTRHYNFGWDAAQKRPVRQQGISPEDEQAAMQQFAEHHQLQHPFAVMPNDTNLYQHYGVSGIPQAVLIDRQGKVRMIRVGSGEANAHALHELIEKLLAESAP